jgi:hypothetical protein
MGKLDIGVGDEFPVDEPAPPSPEDQDAARAAREEWRHRRDEWRQRKQEWRAMRDAWREDMRTRKDAFKRDVRKSFDENFGPRTYRGSSAYLLRFAAVIGIVVLTILLLPFLFMFGFVVLAAVLAFMAGRHHHDYPSGTSNPSQ